MLTTTYVQTKLLLFKGLLLLLLSGFIIPPLQGQIIVNEDWVSLYNGPGNFADAAEAIAIDSEGNVYVTGYSFNSVTVWDYATIKYNGQTGAEIWTAFYNGPGNVIDEAHAIAIDSEDNVYVTGWIDGFNNEFDYGTIKYSGQTGAEIWTAQYNGPGNGDDRAYAIAVDSESNVYVTGYSKGSGTALDYATIKYNGQTGAEIWTARYNGPGNYDDRAYAIAIDSEDNVYVTGASSGLNFFWDYATIKYNGQTGAEIWIARYNGPDNVMDLAKAIVVDTEGNVYITGSSNNSEHKADYATIKYNGQTGSEIWITRYDGLANDRDEANAIAIDSEGNVYVTGFSSGVSWDYATIKYNGQTGEEVWTTLYDGLLNDTDVADAIVIDNEDYVYVTGVSNGFNSGDYVTIKYNNQTGEEIWTAVYNGPNNLRDKANAIAVDCESNIYVTGYSEGLNSFWDYATIKYTQHLITIPDAIEELIHLVQELPLNDGNKNALNSKLQNALKSYNEGKLIAARNQLNAFLNQLYQFIADGTISQADAQPLIDYANQIIDAINAQLAKEVDQTRTLPQEYSLHQNYPNPFNPKTNIGFKIAEPGFVSLKVYDLMGKEVAVLVNGDKQPGVYEVEFDASSLASGTYFYRLSAGSFTETKKLLLMK